MVVEMKEKVLGESAERLGEMRWRQRVRQGNANARHGGGARDVQKEEEDENEEECTMYGACVDAVARAVLAFPPSAVLPRVTRSEPGRFFETTARNIGLLRLKKDAEIFNTKALRTSSPSSKPSGQKDATSNVAGASIPINDAPSVSQKPRASDDGDKLLYQLLAKHRVQEIPQQPQHQQHNKRQRSSSNAEPKEKTVKMKHTELMETIAFEAFHEKMLESDAHEAGGWASEEDREWYIRRRWRAMSRTDRREYYTSAIAEANSARIAAQTNDAVAGTNEPAKKSETDANQKTVSAAGAPAPKAATPNQVSSAAAPTDGTATTRPAATAGDAAKTKSAGAGTSDPEKKRGDRIKKAIKRAQEIMSAKGANRVHLKYTLTGPPPGFTGLVHHQLSSLTGITFYVECHVADVDDLDRVMKFSIEEPEHGVCFNTGKYDSASRSLRCTYSTLYALYKLPDGSCWAEHGNFIDKDDLEAEANSLNIDVGHFGMVRNELLRRTGRFHTKVDFIEDECLIYPKQQFLNKEERKSDDSAEELRKMDVYFFSRTVDELLMEIEEPGIDAWPTPQLPPRRQYMTKRRKAEIEAASAFAGNLV